MYSTIKAYSVELLIQRLDLVHPLTRECRDSLEKALREKVLSKKEVLLRMGHYCREIYFVEAGLLRSYYSSYGVDVSIRFFKERDVFVAAHSFFGRVSSTEMIQALEPCRLWYLEYLELMQLYRSFPELNYIARVLLERSLVQEQQMVYAMRTMRVPQRYRVMREYHPTWLDRVPGKYLASYLGTTPETLSQLRRSGDE